MDCFHQFISFGPKGCKLMKINTSFRIRGKNEMYFYIL